MDITGIKSDCLELMMKNIVLIGIMGSGKTTVARILSSELNMPAIDTDTVIEKEYGPIPLLFERSEECFREAESRVISEVSMLSGYLVSTGGGVVLRESNIDALKKNGILFFLDRPLQDIIGSIECSGRPLLKNGPEALNQIYEKRYPLYKAYCHYHIRSNGDVSATVSAIKEILKNIGLLVI